MPRIRKRLSAVFVTAAVLLTACSIPGLPVAKVATPTPARTPTPSLPLLGQPYTPQQLRAAYDVQPLLNHGYDGKGQTVVLIESFGAPALQSDLNNFDAKYGLPDIQVQQLAPLGTIPYNPSTPDMTGWAVETELDVEMVHSMAPGAGIVVLTSPVDETEGTIGLPQFLQLEQYAVNHHLGNIISQSFGASEVTLADSAGQQEIAQWTSFFQQATTQQGITFFASSGDNGATDYRNLAATQLSPVATTGFPADEPWVTAVGGTTMETNGTQYSQQAWDHSGGGFSRFFAAPSYQKSLPSAVQAQLANRRGVPDVAALADPATGFLIVSSYTQNPIGGTSASAPLWAGLMAIADQMAGHPLGFINPALYQIEQSSHGSADFTDITSGNNSINSGGVNVQGYPAVPGWDPITGLGAPNAAKLLPDLVAKG